MTQIVAHDSDSKVVSKRTESVLTTCLVVYYIGACLGVFTVNHEIGFGYYALEMSAKYFGAPLLLAVYFGLRLTFFRRQSRRSMIWVLVVAMFVASSMILLSFGYFSLVNAYVGKQEAIILSGAIVKKKVYGVRRTMYGVVGDFAGRRVELNVSQAAYERSQVGDSFSKNMIRGSLGYYYTNVFLAVKKKRQA